MPTTTLTPHRANAAVYGDALDLTNPDHQRFLETVKLRGLVQPIIVAADGQTIIAGHRRYEAAVLSGLSTVSVQIRLDLIDPIQVEEALLDGNEQRDKNNAIKGREFTWRKRLEADKAKARQQLGQAPDVKDRSKEREDATEKAARAAGFGSKHTANKAEAIMNAVDDLKKRGKVKEADAIMSDMTDQTKSVGHVYSKHIKAKAAKPPAPKPKSGARTPTPSEEIQAKKALHALNQYAKQLPPVLMREWKGYFKIMRERLEKF